MHPESGFRIAPIFVINWKKWQWRHSLLTWRHRQIFLTLPCFSCEVSLLVQVSCQQSFLRDWPEKSPVWVLAKIWRLGLVRNAKYGRNVSNEKLLNATKCQNYSFYRFWVLNGKPTRERGGGGWVKIPPHPD